VPISEVAMIAIDEYVMDVLLRDLVGHDRRPVCFLVYVWLTAEEQRRKSAVEISYREMAESLGVSKSSVQAAVAWLLRRKLLTVQKSTVTATPIYEVQRPWRKLARKKNV
jgi:predicted DNA-binding transcriptional regulator